MDRRLNIRRTSFLLYMCVTTYICVCKRQRREINYYYQDLEIVKWATLSKNGIVGVEDKFAEIFTCGFKTNVMLWTHWTCLISSMWNVVFFSTTLVPVCIHILNNPQVTNFKQYLINCEIKLVVFRNVHIYFSKLIKLKPNNSKQYLISWESSWNLSKFCEDVVANNSCFH